jgi:DNA-binding CsgD family transcriptional regulator
MTAPKPSSSASADRVDRLTKGQRDCLRLVYNHMTSKDIARALNVSPHTVDMRLRTAMRVLGVTSRIEAARTLVDAERAAGIEHPAYQPLIYGSPDMVADTDSGKMGATVSAALVDGFAAAGSHTGLLRPDIDPSVSGPPRSADASNPSEAAMLGSRSGVSAFDPGADTRPLPGILPTGTSADAGLPLPWGARNTLSVPVRLAWVAGISIGSALAFGAVLSALQALKSLL